MLAAMIRDATSEDAAEIAEIWNHAIRTSAYLYTSRTMGAANRAIWIAARQADGHPVLVMEEAGRVTGFATYGQFRPADGYRATIEHSVYLAEGASGGGRGRALMEALLDRARAARVHVMVAVVDAENAGSIAFHERLGFDRVGVMPGAGQKFGQWRDPVILQLTLDDSAAPGA